MPTVFSRIISGEFPGRFVWRDETAVAFLSINPLSVGHTLVVPVEEVDHWLDLDDETWQHLQVVTRHVGAAIQRAFDPPRVGTVIAGFEVPHVHVHVLQAHDLTTFDFRNAAQDPDEDTMDDAAEAIRTALRDLGHTGAVQQR